MFPSDDATELEWLLFNQDGVISRAQALRVMSESALKRHLANGRWQVAHRAIYVSHNGEISAQQRRWVGVLFGDRNGRHAPLAGLSALQACGFRGFAELPVHIYVPAVQHDHNPPAFVRVHRTRVLRLDDVHSAGLPRTRASRAVIDAAGWADSDSKARAIVASAFQQRLVTLPQLLDAAAAMRRLSRRGLILEAANDAAGGAESISELGFLRLCRRGRLPEPSRQTVIYDLEGKRRYRDAYFEEWHLHVEIDGAQHLDVRSWWADMKRQNAMWIKGDRVLRFPAWAIRNEPQKVIKAVRDALLAAGWRP